MGRFELVRELGRGGFGVVYEAVDRDLGRSVAFKAIFHPGQPALYEERIVVEAEAAARLSHPNIVTLYDLGKCEHGPYLVLELLCGETLESRLGRGPMPLREALRVAADVARALAHAHSKGVVHRDLKPGNVFLCDSGAAKLLDFGLAQAFGRRPAGGGTPPYMAPEQRRGAPEDERTDVFAMGVVLFRMLSGELPFGNEGERASRPAPALEIPESPALGRLVARMLSRDPVERPRDGGEALAALEEIGTAIEVAPQSVPAARPRRRPLSRMGVLLGAGALLGAGMAVLALRGGGPPPPPTDAGGRVVVAVADFANETGERELDALSGLLVTSLEQSKRLRVLTRARLFDLARSRGHANVERIDEVLGREVGQAAGARALLVAAVHRFGSLYAVELRALDPRGDAYLFTIREEAPGKEAIPALIDRLADRARRELREDAVEVAASRITTAEAVTSNLEAYQHVFRGMQLYNDDGDPEGAAAALRRAIALEPGLALAHLWLAIMVDFNDAPEEDAEAHLEIAAQAAARLPARDRGMVLAWKAHHDGHHDRARELFARLAADHPLDKEVLYLAGESLFHSPRQAESEGAFAQALALDPGFAPALAHLRDLLVARGRAVEAVERARAAAAAKAKWPTLLQLAIALGQSGDLSGALAEARRAEALGGRARVEISMTSAAALAALGRFGEAQAELAPWTREAVYVRHRLTALANQVEVLAMQGRRAEALASLARLRRADPRYDVGWRAEVQYRGIGGNRGAVREALRMRRTRDPSWAATYEYFGLPERAAQLASGLRPGSADERAWRANVAWRAGRPGERLAWLRELTAAEPNTPLAFWLGEALAESERCAEAVVEFERVERLFPVIGGSWRASFWPESFVRRAGCLERLGRREEALALVDRFLSLWRRADPGLPLLAEAKALRARLAR